MNECKSDKYLDNPQLNKCHASTLLDKSPPNNVANLVFTASSD